MHTNCLDNIDQVLFYNYTHAQLYIIRNKITDTFSNCQFTFNINLNSFAICTCITRCLCLRVQSCLFDLCHIQHIQCLFTLIIMFANVSHLHHIRREIHTHHSSQLLLHQHRLSLQNTMLQLKNQHHFCICYHIS